MTGMTGRTIVSYILIFKFQARDARTQDAEQNGTKVKVNVKMSLCFN